jgi:two-component system, OmpR family, sensor histidine kinase SenX3
MSLRTRISGGGAGGSDPASPPGPGASNEVEQLAEALLALPDAAIVVDNDGTEILRNESAERFRDGRHTDALAEEQINELLAQARRGQGGERELQLFGPPPEVLALRAQPLVSDGAIIGAVVFIRDISETRRKEGVRRDFVANVSHELKTPIGALALLAETMAEGGDEVVIRQLAERVAREADRLGRIIDDLLNLSLIEAQESPSREPVPIAVLISEAVEAVRPAAAAAGIPLEVATDLPDSAIPCDRRQVLSALTNLLDNAIKYSESPNAVQISASTSDGLATIAVVDHGPGIPSRDLERIFERFYRVDRARSRATGGTGLGLSIVRHVAHAHGGDVTVESREGEGSTFRLRLAQVVSGDGPSGGYLFEERR